MASATGSARQFSVRIPADATPGETKLHIDVGADSGAGGESELVVLVPEGAQPGDRMMLWQDPETQKWQAKLVRSEPSQAQLPDVANGNVFSRLVEAVRLAGGFVSAKLHRAQVSPGLFGLIALEPIAAGEELLRIPSELRMLMSAIQATAPELCSAVAGLELTRPGLRDEVQMTAFLAKLLGEAMNRENVASSTANTVWLSFADALLDEDFRSHPYWKMIHDAKLTQATLAPSLEAEHLAARSKEVLQSCRLLAQKVPSDMLGAGFGPGMYMHARLCWLTRSFDVDTVPALCPLADMFNHSHEAGVHRECRHEADPMVLTATRAHARGEQLCISYGAKANPLLYRTYGFTIAPEYEPAWGFVLQGKQPAAIYSKYLPESLAQLSIHFDTSCIRDSLATALCAAHGQGQDAKEFLRELCAHCCQAYELDPDAGISAALAALRRARAADPSSGAWWAEMRPEDLHPGGSSPDPLLEDALRVKMSEYLALTVHKEVADLLDGHLSEANCLSGGARAREALKSALAQLKEQGSFEP
ncbi:unnamed protein product [Polarella glacialis]|uniref:SET domain-containing protein n=1 Tax=Polarella glacialis TaxID=89957 RepID=A0A813ID63_POLGL|nr:unnamed protein product [Polarella glacialis]